MIVVYNWGTMLTVSLRKNIDRQQQICAKEEEEAICLILFMDPQIIWGP